MYLSRPSDRQCVHSRLGSIVERNVREADPRRDTANIDDASASWHVRHYRSHTVYIHRPRSVSHQLILRDTYLGYSRIAPNKLTENCLSISSSGVSSVEPGMLQPALFTGRLDLVLRLAAAAAAHNQ